MPIYHKHGFETFEKLVTFLKRISSKRRLVHLDMDTETKTEENPLERWVIIMVLDFTRSLPLGVSDVGDTMVGWDSYFDPTSNQIVISDCSVKA